MHDRVPVHTRVSARGYRCLRAKIYSCTKFSTANGRLEQEDSGGRHGHHGHGHRTHLAAFAAANLDDELVCAGKSARRRRPAALVRACALVSSSSSLASLLSTNVLFPNVQMQSGSNDNESGQPQARVEKESARIGKNSWWPAGRGRFD